MLKLAEADESIAESHLPGVLVADLHADLAGPMVVREGQTSWLRGISVLK